MRLAVLVLARDRARAWVRPRSGLWAGPWRGSRLGVVLAGAPALGLVSRAGPEPGPEAEPEPGAGARPGPARRPAASSRTLRPAGRYAIRVAYAAAAVVGRPVPARRMREGARWARPALAGWSVAPWRAARLFEDVQRCRRGAPRSRPAAPQADRLGAGRCRSRRRPLASAWRTLGAGTGARVGPGTLISGTGGARNGTHAQDRSGTRLRFDGNEVRIRLTVSWNGDGGGAGSGRGAPTLTVC